MKKLLLLFIVLLVYTSCRFSSPWPGGYLGTQLRTTQGSHSDRIELSWTGVIGADGYYVYVCDVEKGIFEKLDAELQTETSYTCTVLVPYFYWYFRISAVRNGVESILSAPVRGWVEPTGIQTQYDAAEQTLAISWNATPDVLRYRVLISYTDSGPFSRVSEYTEATLDADSFIVSDGVSERIEVVIPRIRAADRWYRIRAYSSDDTYTTSCTSELFKDAAQ